MKASTAKLLATYADSLETLRRQVVLSLESLTRLEVEVAAVKSGDLPEHSIGQVVRDGIDRSLPAAWLLEAHRKRIDEIGDTTAVVLESARSSYLGRGSGSSWKEHFKQARAQRDSRTDSGARSRR